MLTTYLFRYTTECTILQSSFLNFFRLTQQGGIDPLTKILRTPQDVGYLRHILSRFTEGVLGDFSSVANYDALPRYIYDSRPCVVALHSDSNKTSLMS